MTRLLLAVLVVVGGLAPTVAHAGALESTSVPVRSHVLDDLGVVDYDGDEDLDIFTTNHLNRQSLLTNDGNGGFTESLSALGLDHAPDFPGWEQDGQAPAISAPGLYIYRAGDTVLEYVAAAPGPISGSLELLTGATVDNPDGAALTITSSTGADPGTRVDYSAMGSFRLVVKPDQGALPVSLTVDAPLPLAQVFVGEVKAQPSARRFTVTRRDRHGIAWADVNDDRRTDAFVVRGGVSGTIGQFNGLIQDELLLRSGSRFVDGQFGSGLEKGTCRGRTANAVDVDQDGRLDLFSSCSGSTPKLYRGLSGGGYTDESEALAAVRSKGTEYQWLDVNLDGALELLVAKKRRFTVFRRRGSGEWKRRQVLRGSQRGAVKSLAVADFDRDGDPDVFVGGSGANVLLQDVRGRLTDRNPKQFGLPRSGSPAVAWVDYDNDGRADLHALPQGIFRARRGTPGLFRRTGKATTRAGISVGIPQWFDGDGDGDRDGLIATHIFGEKDWPVELLVNQRRGRRWLQVELDGQLGNVEGIGARVRVKARKGGPVQTAWVGDSDSSRLSQGHYRLYFGLGELKTRIRSVHVNWPNGGHTRLKGVKPDRLLRVEQL